MGCVSNPGGKCEKSSRRRASPEVGGGDACVPVAAWTKGSKILCEKVAPATAAPFLRKALRSIWIRTTSYLVLLTSLLLFNRDLPLAAALRESSAVPRSRP